jgi:inner membrane protein
MSASTFPAAIRTPSRSMGLKLLLVCGLALLMTIPALFVFALLMDRTHRAETVSAELGQIMGGKQTFMGPVIGVPYILPAAKPGEAPTQGLYVIYPVTAKADAVTATSIRQRSLFKTPVYTADLTFDSVFDLGASPQALPIGAVLDWSRAEFLMGVTDARGAKSEIVLRTPAGSVNLAPARALSTASLGEGDSQMFGAAAAGLAQPGSRFAVQAKMKFTGAQRLAVLAWGKTTELHVKGDWAHPSYDGGFLPVSKAPPGGSFEARWTVPFIARGAPAEGTYDSLSRLGATALGVSFVEPANPYQSVARSLKYALMFVGLVFLAYFIFETMSGQRVHPAQYVLVGLSQIVFYLLLLSIAERVGFDLAFVVAAAATVSLISAYAGWVFASRARGFQALAAFTVLYGLIYVLMRLEDWALLVGAVASFAAIAAVMFFTRKVDWYGSNAAPAVPTAS